MTPYCVEQGDITKEDLKLLYRVNQLVRKLPDGLSCHQVCLKISQQENQLVPVKGKFRGLVDHSWCEIRDRPLLILDPYPCAAASGPLLITLEGTLNPWRYLYFPLPGAIPNSHLYDPCILKSD